MTGDLAFEHVVNEIGVAEGPWGGGLATLLWPPTLEEGNASVQTQWEKKRTGKLGQKKKGGGKRLGVKGAGEKGWGQGNKPRT